MSISPSTNLPDNPQPPALPRWIYFVFVILLGGIGYLAWAGYTARTQFNSDIAKSTETANQLSARLDQANGRIAELRGQLEVTSRHVNLTEAEVARAHSLAQQIQLDQKASDNKLASQIGQVKRKVTPRFPRFRPTWPARKRTLTPRRKIWKSPKAN